MRTIRLLVLLGLGCFSALIAVDFFQIGRVAPALAAAGDRATLIEVNKSARQMTLMRGTDVIKTYRISLGAMPTGQKLREGDRRTPEGTYAIDFKNARSRFHLGLKISYPSIEDRQAALARGDDPGGDIMIHGLPNGLSWLGAMHLNRDWTDGCIAVTNREMKEIWSLIALNTPVVIKP